MNFDAGNQSHAAAVVTSDRVGFAMIGQGQSPVTVIRIAPDNLLRRKLPVRNSRMRVQTGLERFERFPVKFDHIQHLSCKLRGKFPVQLPVSRMK